MNRREQLEASKYVVQASCPDFKPHTVRATVVGLCRRGLTHHQILDEEPRAIGYLSWLVKDGWLVREFQGRVLTNRMVQGVGPRQTSDAEEEKMWRRICAADAAQNGAVEAVCKRREAENQTTRQLERSAWAERLAQRRPYAHRPLRRSRHRSMIDLCNETEDALHDESASDST